MKKYHIYRLIPARKLEAIEDSYNIEVLQFIDWFDTEEEAIAHIKNIKERSARDVTSHFTILPIY